MKNGKTSESNKSSKVLQYLPICSTQYVLGFPNTNLFDGWLVGCSGFNGPLRQYFSPYWAVSQREGDRKEKL